MAQHHSASSTRVDNSADEGKIRAGHLLVKHKESRRPSSWKQQDITRSKEEAISILKGYEQQINSGQVTLGDLAVSESDCSSARKRGDLGFFGKGQMQKEFEDAAFALNPGQMSGVVETASGVHLIQRFVEEDSQSCRHTDDWQNSVIDFGLVSDSTHVTQGITSFAWYTGSSSSEAPMIRT